MTNFAKLFEPGRIGSLHLKNRIVLSPMITRFATSDGGVSDRLIDYYVERARGGVGLVVVEATYPLYRGYPGRLSISEDKYIPGLARLAEAIRDAGAKVIIELNPHRGRADEVDPATASPVPHPATGVVPRQLTVDDIKAIVAACADGARRARDAGFDGVVLHGGSGYLVAEFLSPRINQRTDEYGGDAKRRARLALELVQATKKATGQNFQVVFRMVADERIENGFGIKDAIPFCKMLEEAGVDALDVGSGAAETYEWVIPCTYLPRAANVDLSGPIKNEARVPVVGVGRIDTAAIAEEILSAGKADFIAMGRALIADPQMPRKAFEGRTDEIKRCIACLKCVERVVYKGTPLLCTINPSVGNEKEYASKATAPVKKRVLVIGGGPAGMEAAVVARKRGHDVTLWEKTDSLGGQMLLASKPPAKDVLNLFLRDLLDDIQALGITVEHKKVATAESVVQFSPDAVVVAVGSVPMVPKIEGIDESITSFNRDAIAGRVALGKKVVVIGGGSVGCETADFLAEQGKDVTIIEILDRIANDVIPNVRNCLLKRLREQGIVALTSIKRVKILSSGVEILDGQGNTSFLAADNVVLATGSMADEDLYQRLQGKVANLYRAGDCLKARTILEAVDEGARAALEI